MTRLKSLLIISICVLFYAAYYWAVPCVVNIKSKIPEIKSLAKSQIGIDIDLKNPSLKMGLTPSIWLEADYFSVIDEHSIPLAVSHPKLKIKLLPLLIGKIELGYFSCDNINAKFKIDKNNKLYIGNQIILKNSNPKFSLENSKIYIKNYKIELKDELHAKNILINGDYFDLNKFNSKKYINFSTNSRLKINEKTTVINLDLALKLPIKSSLSSDDIILDGTVTNFNLADISPYVKRASNNNIKNITGLLNIEAETSNIGINKTRIKTLFSLDNFGMYKNDAASSIIFKGKLFVNSLCNFSNNRMEIIKFKMRSNGIDIDANGKISQINSKQPNIDLKIAAKNTHAETLIPLFPNTKEVNNFVNVPALKKYILYSNINGKLSIKGKSDKPHLSGSFICKDTYVIKPPPNNIQKATVSIKFIKDKLHLNVFVPTGTNENVTVKGQIEAYGDEKADLIVASTPKVNLELVELILNPIHEIFLFEIGPVPDMKLKGDGNIFLKIQGNKQTPHLIGQLNFINATASFNGINAELKNSYGSLFFQDTTTHFITKSAFLNNKPIKIDGKCSLKGELDFDIIANSQDLNKLLVTIKSSAMLVDLKNILPDIKNSNGQIDAKLKLYGKVLSINDFKLGKSIFLKGHIKLLKNTIELSGVNFPIGNLAGDIDFDGENSNFNLHSFANQSKIYLNGKIKNGDAKIELKGNIKSNQFIFDGDIKNIFQKTQVINATFNSDNFDISAIKNLPFTNNLNNNFSSKPAKYISQINNPIGFVNLKAVIKNNQISSKIRLNDISFRYSDKKIPIKIISGNLELNKNKLVLYKINSTIDSMPILVDGFISDLFSKPNVNIYLNSKPNQRFIERYLNKNSIYPLKIKGDIIYSARIKGNKNSFNTKAEVNMESDSSIYYMGSTIGDVDNPIRIYLDTTVRNNVIDVHNFQYDKLISSQNGKEFISPQINAKGTINYDKSNIIFKDLRAKTLTPTDAKVFNIIFKKPLIKQGMFTANIVINNSITAPKILGELNFNGINIPLLDTTVKDISLNFNRDNIDIKSKGEVFGNRIVLFITMQNKLAKPLVLDDVDVYFGNLDVNQITKSINKLEIDSDKQTISEPKQNFDISALIIRNGKLKADSILVKNVYAKDLSANFNLNEKLIFSLKDFKFDVAQGKVNGNFKYNLLNSNASLELHVDDVNANMASEALFDLQNQVYGSLTGQVDLTCNGKTHKTCMGTLSGNGGFRIANGRMPKLGSLEYLLKAANLVKSGVTGITINSLIELVTPLKTGQFENINGNFTISSGIADSIQVFSKGKDLSIFLTGTYNFSTLIADMEVFGRISKKISNALGPIGNTSLNTLFNTIPGLNLEESNSGEFVKKLNKIPGFEFNDKTFRIFSAKIYGDINGENYVQSFKWVE